MSSGFGVGELSLFMVLFAAHTDFLYRVCQLVGVHSNMHCLIRHSSVDRWTGGGGTAAQVYIPKSPLSALPAVAVLSGFPQSSCGHMPLEGQQSQFHLPGMMCWSQI